MPKNQIETPQYRSIADSAVDGLFLLEELRNANSALNLISELCYTRSEDELADAISVLIKTCTQTHDSLEEKLQRLVSQTKGMQIQGGLH